MYWVYLLQYRLKEQRIQYTCKQKMTRKKGSTFCTLSTVYSGDTGEINISLNSLPPLCSLYWESDNMSVGYGVDQPVCQSWNIHRENLCLLYIHVNINIVAVHSDWCGISFCVYSFYWLTNKAVLANGLAENSQVGSWTERVSRVKETPCGCRKKRTPEPYQ